MKSKIHEYQKTNIKNMSKKIVFVLSVLAFISCKKESQESFGKPETTIETTTEVQKPEELGKEIFNGK